MSWVNRQGGDQPEFHGWRMGAPAFDKACTSLVEEIQGMRGAFHLRLNRGRRRSGVMTERAELQHCPAISSRSASMSFGLRHKGCPAEPVVGVPLVTFDHVQQRA